MLELWAGNQVSSQEMSLTIALGLIDLEVLKFDHFSWVVKKPFSKPDYKALQRAMPSFLSYAKRRLPSTLWGAVYIVQSYKETYHSGPIA